MHEDDAMDLNDEGAVAAVADALRDWQRNDPEAMRYYVPAPGEHTTTVWIDKAEIPARIAITAYQRHLRAVPESAELVRLRRELRSLSTYGVDCKCHAHVRKLAAEALSPDEAAGGE